jgi:hypothetical protein
MSPAPLFFFFRLHIVIDDESDIQTKPTDGVCPDIDTRDLSMLKRPRQHARQMMSIFTPS